MNPGLHTRSVRRIDEIAPATWNALGLGGEPFVRHEFLHCLEQQGCLGRHVGWFANHLVCEDEGGHLLGTSPLYLKTNSFGEFVFDWSWASAHERLGLAYYPKAVIAVPFTPASGPRLLVAPGSDRETVARCLIGGAIRIAQKLRISSVHWLFSHDPDLAAMPELLVRKGCQFHWENRRYRDFGDFLDTLSAKRRKEIKRERRRVADAGISVTRIRGSDASEAQWALFHRFYRSTFAKHGNYAALRYDFFRELGRSMGSRILLMLAAAAGREIAAALFFQSDDTLYGRYWGAEEDVPALHFELCYYQGIEYCIENQLARFEPGAQGEHKVSRGFDPRPTWSYHWIADTGLREAIARSLRYEIREVDAYMRSIGEHSAYRETSAC